MDDEDKLLTAISLTRVLRAPRQTLATFGVTTVNYHILTRPAYASVSEPAETVVRQGKVVTEKPRIVTAYYMSMLEGFSKQARQYFENMYRSSGGQAAGIYYTYRNEPGGLEILGDGIEAVAERISIDIDRRGDHMAAIISGQDELWDVSLMKFVLELTGKSVHNNLTEMHSLGLLETDRMGVPLEARLNIERMMSSVQAGETRPGELKDELERWGLFEEYQDRFLAIFRR
jgi:hypothetical protein